MPTLARICALICLVSPFTSTISAQATMSEWLKIAPSTFGLAAQPAPGAGYLTVHILAASAYQHSNWWTNFIERGGNRHAVATANLSAKINNVPVEQTITGRAIEIHDNNSMVPLGLNALLVDHLPTTFSDMNITLQINKTSQDGLKDLIDHVSSLSQTQPPVLSTAVTAEATAITSFTKRLADFLFNANLLVSKFQSQNAFPTSGGKDPGIYVCFAGDQRSDFEQYLKNANALKWSGGDVKFQDQLVDKVSYFVIEIAYQDKFLGQPIDALSFGASKPWVALYQTARREIQKISSATDAQKIASDIQSQLFDAATLLDVDYGFIDSERESIEDAVHSKIDEEYKKRLTLIGLTPGGPIPMPPPVQPGAETVPPMPPPAIVKLSIEKAHRKDLVLPRETIRSLDPGKLMTSTAGTTQ